MNKTEALAVYSAEWTGPDVALVSWIIDQLGGVTFKKNATYIRVRDESGRALMGIGHDSVQFEPGVELPFQAFPSPGRQTSYWPLTTWQQAKNWGQQMPGDLAYAARR